MSDLIKKGCEACAKGLREFGYPGITTEDIETCHKAWKRGDEPETVIDHFAYADFDNTPAIFGHKDGSE